MEKKLLSGFFIISLFLLVSFSGYGQCPTSVSISSDKGNTICAGTEVTFTASANGGTNLAYQWQIGQVNQNNETNSTFKTSSLTNGQKVRVVVTSTAEGFETCSISSSEITMTVNVVRTPTVSISSNKTSICPGESVTYTASNTFGGTSPQYSFYLNGETSTLQTGSSNTFTTTTLDNGDRIRVVLTSNLECVTSSTAEVTSSAITVRAGTPVKPGTISAAETAICPGASQTYSISPVTGASSYQWTLPSGWAGNSTSTSITATAGTNSGTISVKAINDCGTGEAENIEITVKAGTPAVPNNISGETAVCPGVSQTYSITDVANASVYIWTLPSGWSGTSTTNSITVTTGPSGSGNISVQAKNDCGTSTARNLAVSVKAGTPAQPGTITGTAEVCPGVSQTYSITAVTGATSYIWTLPNSGWTGTSTTNSITVTSGTTGGNISVKATNDCGTSVEQTLALTVKAGTPATPGTINGATTICPGDVETYSFDAVSGATEYIWSLPSGFSAPSTTTASPSIDITAGNSGSGTITVKAVNSCGTSATSSISISINNPVPVMSGTITGPAEMCSTATGLQYSIPAITNATEYVWTVPSGWTITGGTGTRTITVSASSNSGNIFVIAKNTCGDSASSANFAVTSVTGVPATPGALTAPNLPTGAICPPATGIQFTVPTVTGANSYLWTLPTGWEITSGAGSNSITVRVNSTAATTANASVSVQAVNICGNSEKSTLSGIAIDNHVVTNAGADQTVCKVISPISIEGTYSFSGTNANLKPTWSAPTGMGSFDNASKLAAKFTPTQAALDAGSVIITLTTDAPSGACGPGKDEMKITFKPLITATIAATSPACNGNTSTLTFTGTPNSRITYKKDNGANQTVDIGASGTAIVTTAVLTANATYSLVSGLYLDTPACSNALTGSATITITAKPTAVIAYSAAPFCTALSTGQTPSLTGTGAYTGGTYSSTTGLTIDSSTGAVTPSTSTPGTYTVTYKTPASGGCEEIIATTEITITKQPTASITYSGIPFCTSDSDSKPVTLSGTDGFSGGTFSAPAGLTIDATTGAITASSSTAGTYLITYETPSAGGCSPVPATTEIVITKAPTVTISYPDAPFCLADTSEKEVTIEGTDAYTGGTYSAMAGLSINSSSGAIDPAASSVGTYTVSYKTPATAGCGEVTATTEVSITQTPFVEIAYDGPFCTADETAQSVNFTNGIGIYEGGTFSSNPGGLDLDPSTGAINPKTSNPDTYKVTYTIPASLGCDAVVVETEVTITLMPQVSISYETPLCNTDDAIAVSYSSTMGDYTGGIFSATSGLVIEADGSINPQASTPGIHTITYSKETEGDGCAIIEATTQVEIFEKVQITTQPVNFGTCSTNPASFEVVATGDNLAYQWYKKDTGGTFVQINGETNPTLSFSNATSTNAGEYYVVVSSSNAVCASETSDPVTLNIDEDIVIIKPAEDITICEDDYESLSFDYEAHANGAELTFQWIKDGNPINEVADKYVMTKSGPTGTDGVYTGTLTILNIDSNDDGIYAVIIDGPDYFTCPEATSKSFTFRVNKRPDKPVTATVEYCLNATPTALTATKANEDNELLWYSYDASSTEYTYLGTSVTPTTETAGTTSYWVTQKQPNSCESDPAELVVTVYDKPQPIATETIQFSFCFNETVTDPISLTPAEGTTLNWYDAENATTALSSAPTPNTGEVKLTSYWVSQTLTSTGCESERTKVDIIINELPNVQINIADGFASEICLNSSTKLVASGATNYMWYFNNAEIGTDPEVTVTGNTVGTFEYKVIGTDANGCINENVFSINVEEPSQGGTVSGPSSVCVSNNAGTLTVADFKGEILRWESTTDGTNWAAISMTTENLDFQNISGTTTFRAIVKNGVCDEVPSTEIAVSIDPLPIGGELAFENFGRVLETCSNPGSDYNVPINLTGETGTVVRWRYAQSTATSWSTVMVNGEPFTGKTLTAELIKSLGLNQTTIFEVEMTSGACTPNVFSQNATLSIISSDIAPNPVTVTPGVVCIGELVTLSASSGYGNASDVMSGGDFNNANSLTNEGWRVRRDGSTTNLDFPASGNNTRPNIWSNTNDQPFYTANINNPTTGSNQTWDSGDKKFAIVTGKNASTLETPVFNTYAMESATLTFDQGYNLTEGAIIRVEISTDGGANYQSILYEVVGPATSESYNRFGSTSDPRNKISIDLASYLGQGNLRIRWHFIGARDGDVWAIDGLSVPEGPSGVEMIWTDYTDPDNPVEIGRNNSEQWEPSLIGLNEFEIKTRLTFDSTGAQCPVVENSSTINVFVFDQYTSKATALGGSCGFENVQLKGSIENSGLNKMKTFPTADGYSAKWEVVTKPAGYTFSEAHFSPSIKDTAAIFSPGIEGEYTLQYSLSRPEDQYKNESCPPVYEKITFTVKACTTLDFDGIDDFVDLGEGYTGDYSIEAWIRPEAATGTIISTPQLEINMSDLSGLVSTNGRWYHIAVDSDGKLYVDGIAKGTTISGTGDVKRSFIGARWNAPNTENHFSGWIEEVRIWNTKISEKNIRFTMNQRLKDTGNIGVQVDMVHPDAPEFGSLAGYYQLLTTSILNGGYTPDLSGSPVNGKLRNMTTTQENTAPLPYFTKQDGSWDADATWAYPDVWQIPNSGGLDWNIVRTKHNVNSTRDISVLGLISEVNTLDMVGDIPANESHELVGTGKALTISHYLKLDGIIDLNGESQLLQPELSIVDPASTGHLDRDQQGKRNSFIYNYWSSPVSATSINGGYSVGGVLLNGTNPASPISISFPASHAAADGARSPNSLIISAYWLWKFSPATANAYSEWKHIGSTGTVNSGEGFTMKGTDGYARMADGQNYTFRGKPHNGDLTLPDLSVDQNYLIGNPYPSAIDAHEFIRDNLKDVSGGKNDRNVFDGSLYFWDHFQEVSHILKEYIGGYAVLNIGGAVPAASVDERIDNTGEPNNKIPGPYIPVAQGFMINSTTLESAFPILGGKVKFKNSQRKFEIEGGFGSNSLFLKPETGEKNVKAKDTEFKKIRLSFSSPVGYWRQILVGAIPGTTDAFDLGYDAHLFDNNIEDMYFLQGENKLVIQSIADFNKDRIIPLGIKVKENKEFRIRLDTLENGNNELNIYLNDKLKDSIHDLRKSAYFSTSEPGTIHDRFEIIFSKDEEVLPPVEPGPDGKDYGIVLRVRHSYANRQIQILNPEQIEISNLYLFDLNGNLLEDYDQITNEKEIILPVRGYSSGVYILKMYVSDKVITKKIIISN
ncbi:T9SS type A sorting domain-containing protein [Antarcticibacterium arcticum]|uniref:T9SS type A sorting domain-containing protein n=1 Tax=Antarcticibacterium arcticum TaxID=2585771 RepID=A0A5B8YF96_9FLAO|nr:T9SS type A sorting domain-containing protein [Antarcticibacterium arcticum]QED36231.1 T9SS type A sorting domain-containing protein [Antarcticibacterium arcticum]